MKGIVPKHIQVDLIDGSPRRLLIDDAEFPWALVRDYSIQEISGLPTITITMVASRITESEPRTVPGSRPELSNE